MRKVIGSLCPQFSRRFFPLIFCLVLAGLSGCGYNTPGRMEWITTRNTEPHVGTVYCIRGWSGVFSAGIDQMAKQLNEKGVHALVYMPEQYPQLAAAMVEKYKADPQHEPICFIGHSRGCDSSIIISRELEKAGVTVDMIVCLDSVDEDTIPANVRICYNYWMPGVLGGNLLRGIPLKQEAGSTGKVFNYNLDKEYRSWRGDLTDHVSMDDDDGLQKRIVDNILEVCPERSKWIPGAPATSPAR